MQCLDRFRKDNDIHLIAFNAFKTAVNILLNDRHSTGETAVKTLVAQLYPPAAATASRDQLGKQLAITAAEVKHARADWDQAGNELKIGPKRHLLLLLKQSVKEGLDSAVVFGNLQQEGIVTPRRLDLSKADLCSSSRQCTLDNS